MGPDGEWERIRIKAPGAIFKAPPHQSSGETVKKYEITQIRIAAKAVGLHTEYKPSFTDFESEHSNNAF